MAADLPYMISVGNVSAILDRIREAGTPPKFNHEFLSANLGFSSSSDRGIIKVLKQAGFLSTDGSPTARYNEFRASATGGKALAQGLREGWAPIFLSDQRAYDKSSSQLTDTFKSVTGQGEAVAKKMASTFKALASRADWSAEPTKQVAEEPSVNGNGHATTDNGSPLVAGEQAVRASVNLHHDVHVHLPPTSDVTVYRAIFRALREELL